VADLRVLDWSSASPHSAVQADVLCVFPFGSRGDLQALLEAVRPRLVIPLHWDNLFRPLSRPLRPFFQPPRWALPPLQRCDLIEFARGVESLQPGTEVLVPEAFRAYDLSCRHPPNEPGV
jgi:L-ascorbate metabolism protein UlaG (beta-lactamase superfamily)